MTHPWVKTPYYESEGVRFSLAQEPELDGDTNCSTNETGCTVAGFAAELVRHVVYTEGKSGFRFA